MAGSISGAMEVKQAAALGEGNHHQPQPPLTQAPSVSGFSVPLKRRPIEMPMSAEPNMMMKPCTAAAVPAIWPRGSIEIAEKFPARRPKLNIMAVCSTAECSSVPCPVKVPKAWPRDTKMNPTKAAWESLRIPKRSTSRALVSAAMAMLPEQMAKTSGNSLGASNTSAKTCWAELMKPSHAACSSMAASE